MSKYKVDPFNITDFNRSVSELQAFLIFAICVAGKTANQIQLAIEEFLHPCESLQITPFMLINKYIEEGSLEEKIKQSKLGKHSLLIKALPQIIKLNVNNCTINDLEVIHGIGRKTSRFFLVHSRPAQKFAILDVHILRYLREVLGYKKLPKSTPSSEVLYTEIEKICIEDAKKQNKSIAKWDLDIWKMYARNQ